MIVTKIKIVLDNSDGTHSEVEDLIPYEIANIFMCNLITWKNDWAANINTVKAFQECSDNFKTKKEDKLWQQEIR